MNVLFAINDKFVPGFLTAAVSFCVNNPGKHSIFVMHAKNLSGANYL